MGATYEQAYVVSFAGHKAQFLTNCIIEACWTGKLLPLHIASRANHHIAVGFGRGDGDGPSITAGIDTQMVIFDVLAIWKVIPVPVLLRVS